MTCLIPCPRASENKMLPAQKKNLLVLDDRTALFSSPVQVEGG